MIKSRFLLTFEFGDNPLGQLLAQFDTPLVERVDVPNRSLCKNTVLVESNELAESFGSELLDQNCVRRPITLEDPVRHKPVRCAFCLDLLGCLAEGQRLGLGKDVGQ